MPFSLEALPAHKGDCLLLHYGSDGDPKLAVIDGGPGSTYKPHLRPRLQEIREERGLESDEPLTIDWLMVSHIDDDHINGVLELTRDMVNAKQSNARTPYFVRNIWHNSFDDILKTKPVELQAAISAHYGAASNSDAALARSPNISRDAAMILVSVAQGRQLRDDVKVLGLRLNAPFDNKLIMLSEADPGESTAVLNSHLQVQILGPMKTQLETLQKEHDRWLKVNGKQRTDAEAALAAFSDKSVPNLSSIVVLLEQDGKSMLLTGDARGDYILEGLRSLPRFVDQPCIVDVLKVPHHGSDNNVEQAFFEHVRATHYVFSGDGKHGNPERETFEMLFKARKKIAELRTARFEVHLTYSLEDTDVYRREEWDKQFKRGNRTRAWNDSSDSLEAFFKDEANKYRLPFELHAGEGVYLELS